MLKKRKSLVHEQQRWAKNLQTRIRSHAGPLMFTTTTLLHTSTLA